MKKEEHKSRSEKETLELGRKFSALLRPGDTIALSGNLGAGKTTFIKGLALGLGLGHKDEVKSPTFALMHIYPTPVPLYHFDLYRLETEKDLDSIGLDEYLSDDTVICCVEWAERASERMGKRAFRVSLENKGGNARSITIEYPAGRHPR